MWRHSILVLLAIGCSSPRSNAPPGSGAPEPAIMQSPTDDAPITTAVVPDAAPPTAPTTPTIDLAAMKNVTRYPNARELTGGHVNGGPGGMHISWHTTATVDEPERVVAHYEKVLGTRATRDGKTWTFRAEHDDGSTYEASTLDIIPAAIAKDFPGGDVPPSTSERTVVLSSSGVGRSRKP